MTELLYRIFLSLRLKFEKEKWQNRNCNLHRKPTPWPTREHLPLKDKL